MSTSRSGGARAIFEIANGLSERGHDVTIVSLQGTHTWFPLNVDVIYAKEPYLIKILDPINKLRSKPSFEYSSLGGIFNWFKLGFEPDLIKPLIRITPECDINIATWFSTSFAVYRSEKGIPFYFFQDFEELVEPLGHYCIKMFKESLYLPLHIITGSNWLKDWINENYGKNAIVSGYGIDHNIFYPRQDVIKDINGPKVMAIFRGGKYKGDQDMIDSLNILSDKISDLTLIAVGNKQIFQTLINNNTIKFNYKLFENPDDDLMAGLYSSSNIFTFPSHKEGFGLPPLEAMACGTPVVTTDSLGVRDFVENRENAILVPIKDPIQLAEGMHEILTNNVLSKKFIENGLKTVKKYKWENIIDIFENTFENISESQK
jgi:glycosyltransferase involved in cell wall biosynthesis